MPAVQRSNPNSKLDVAGGTLDFDSEILMPRDNVRAFQRSLLGWYHRHGRDLPWRRTRELYPVLVSEIMLQQTQVPTVLSYYKRWLRRFPDFGTLARASENDVLHAWQGLGYYNRARNLQATARIVQDRYRGFFPRDLAAIRELPGIGQYTAHALATFAFDQSVPIVEANTSRVLARLFNLRIPIDQSAGRNALWNRAALLLPRRSARLHNSALIDLGALVCLPQPKCQICPVKRFCRATNPETLPVKRALPRIKRLVEDHALVVGQNRILLEQADRRWRGMWILPRCRRETIGQRQSRLRRLAYTRVFPFTNHRVTLRVFRHRPGNVYDQPNRWFSVHSLNSIPIPSPHRRAIMDLLSANQPGRRRPRPS